MKKSIIISTIAASLLLTATALQAETSDTAVKTEPIAKEQKQATVEKSEKKGNTYHISNQTKHKASVKKEIDTQNKNLQPGSKEVLDGMNKTFAAIKSLQKGDLEGAKKELAEATKLFDTALKANPQLKLVPIASEIKVKELASTPEEIEAATTLAKEALDKHQIQRARMILAPMEDDIITVTQYIPMNLYPVATKKAQELLEKGDKEAALKTLVEGLSTIVSVGVLMPIPLLEAQLLIDNASKLDKAKKEEAKALLEAAKSELKKAMLLGYTDKHSDEYKALNEQIDAIEKEMEGENIVEKLYDKLKKSFSSLIEVTRKDEIKSSNAAKNTASDKDEKESKSSEGKTETAK
jgi:hypothetical protein